MFYTRNIAILQDIAIFRGLFPSFPLNPLLRTTIQHTSPSLDRCHRCHHFSLHHMVYRNRKKLYTVISRRLFTEPEWISNGIFFISLKWCIWGPNWILPIDRPQHSTIIICWVQKANRNSYEYQRMTTRVLMRRGTVRFIQSFPFSSSWVPSLQVSSYNFGCRN